MLVLLVSSAFGMTRDTYGRKTSALIGGVCLIYCGIYGVLSQNRFVGDIFNVMEYTGK